MQILHVSSGIDPRSGGTTAALAGLAEAQHQAGLDITVAATYPQSFDPQISDCLKSQGIRVELIGPSSGPLHRHATLKPTLKNLISKADIVHIHAIWEEIQHQAARIAHQLNKPYVISPHGMLDPWSLKQSWLKKKIYRMLRLDRNLKQASAISYTTDTEQQLAEQATGIQRRAIVETLGVDLNEFEQLMPEGSFRAKYPQLQGQRIILFLSRLHPKKGLDILIPAFAQAKLDNTMLVLAGPGEPEYQKELELLIASHGIQNQVLFTGMLKGVDRLAPLIDGMNVNNVSF